MSEQQGPDRARIGWSSEGHPHSLDYDDVYFSKAGPHAEAEHVFLAGNQLPERWRERAPTGDAPEPFVTVETGFGTGLNFLSTLASWRRHRAAGATLEYRTVERLPPTHADLERIFARWTECDADARRLLAQYTELPAGAHTIHWPDAGVALKLWISDLHAALPDLASGAPVDAWYLDGFVPGRNRDMWTPELYETMARCTRPGGTLATYTVTPEVCDGLSAAGFHIERRDGLPPKKYMLSGVLPLPA